MSGGAIWSAVRNRPEDERAYDDKSGWLNPAVWDRAAGNPEAAVAAILAAVADTAGFFAAGDFDLASDRARATICSIAADLEAAGQALRNALEDCIDDQNKETQS